MQLEEGKLTVGKQNVADSQKLGLEAVVCNSVEMDVACVLHSNGNHGHDDRDGDAEESFIMLSVLFPLEVGVGLGYDLHAKEIQYTFPIVRGRLPMQLITSATIPKTMVQVPWSVIVFMATVKVRIWLAITNTKKSSWPPPSSSRPNRPRMTSPASAML